jgi:hypothetical protein
LSWTNTTGKSGRFTFLVYARDSRNSSALEAYATVSAVIGEVCDRLTSFTASAGTGGLLDLSAAAACTAPGATAHYKFFMLAPGSSAYTEIRSWGESTLSWTNTTGKSGRFTFLVYARDSENDSSYESYRTTSTLIGESCGSISSFSATVNVPGVVELNAVAACSGATATAEYKYYVRAPGSSSYMEIRSWGESSYGWTNNTGLTGTFYFLVYVRDSRNLSVYEVYGTKGVVLNP